MLIAESAKKLNEIIDGVSKLPIEDQEYILAIIKAMAFVHSIIEKTSRTSEQ